MNGQGSPATAIPMARDNPVDYVRLKDGTLRMGPGPWIKMVNRGNLDKHKERLLRIVWKHRASRWDDPGS